MAKAKKSAAKKSAAKIGRVTIVAKLSPEQYANLRHLSRLCGHKTIHETVAEALAHYARETAKRFNEYTP